MKMQSLWTAPLLLLGLAAGCYRVETTTPPPTSPPRAVDRVDVDVKGGRVDVDATTDPVPPKRRDVDIDVVPGRGVDVEVKTKP